MLERRQNSQHPESIYSMIPVIDDDLVHGLQAYLVSTTHFSRFRLKNQHVSTQSYKQQQRQHQLHQQQQQPSPPQQCAHNRLCHHQLHHQYPNLLCQWIPHRSLSVQTEYPPEDSIKPPPPLFVSL